MPLKVTKAGVIHAPKRTKDAGHDLQYNGPDVLLQHGVPTAFPLGVATEFDDTLVGIIKDRSSMAAQGIHVLGGVIDASYRGEWKVVLINLAYDAFLIKTGMRIAQVIFINFSSFNFVETTEFLEESDRGQGGFGSTGK